MASSVHARMSPGLYNDRQECLTPTSSDDYPEQEMIRVIAPAALDEGYSFEAMVDNEPFVVVVPPGGVKEGQEFEVPYPALEKDREDDEPLDTPLSTKSDDTDEVPVQSYSYEDDQGVPTERWRTSLFSCCDVVTQATFWTAWMCYPILLAQILTRLKLTWKARDGAPAEETSLTFNRIIITYCFVLGSLGILPIVSYGILFGATLFFLYIGILLRHTMRKKYKIPRIACCQGSKVEKRCHPYCEDTCCMVFCGCCSVIQMSRHTHNDKEYPGACCTTNGLIYGSPEIV
mmetsp:Transcript_13528/g.19960  ORF Transcript_13528/g.19960 Transcript_13528/m.19960 type:complete len:289 (+) Transcript_13528:79-945(+)